MKKYIFIFIVFLVCCFPVKSFGQAFGSLSNFTPKAMTQGEFVDLAIKLVGIEFFLPKQGGEEKLFESKKNFLVKSEYPVFERAKKDELVDCIFLAEAVYEITTPPEKREDISCEEVMNEFERKRYKITCICGEGVDAASVISLFNDPQFVKDAMEAFDPAGASPYSTALSEAYSTPASPIK